MCGAQGHCSLACLHAYAQLAERERERERGRERERERDKQALIMFRVDFRNVYVVKRRGSPRIGGNVFSADRDSEGAFMGMARRASKVPLEFYSRISYVQGSDS